MSFNTNQPHGGGPAGAPPNMAASFNAMLQRSLQDQGPPEPAVEAPSNPPSAIGEILVFTHSIRDYPSNRFNRRIRRSIQCHAPTTARRPECPRWRTRPGASADSPRRSPAASLPHLCDALGHGRQYAYLAHGHSI